MPDEKRVCPRCGAAVLSAGTCSNCDDATRPVSEVSAEMLEWTRVRDGLKLKWVASVLAFWISAAVLGVVLLMDDRIDLTLTSITLGMLVIGIWLKTRYRVHQRKQLGR